MFRTAPAILFVSLAALCGAQTAISPDLSSDAATVLSEANQARQAALNHEQTAALNHIQNARNMAAQIQSAMAGKQPPLLVPVTTQVETSTMYTGVKRHRNGAVTLKKNTNVSEVNQHVTSGQLDVTTAADYLDAAESDVRNLDWNSAADNLSAATQLVQVDVSNQDVPLLLAKQNLLLARTRIEEGRYKAAVLPLREASNALAQFERQGYGPVSQQAADMRASIDVYSHQLGQNSGVDRINNWMDTITHWQEQTGKPLYPELNH